MNSSIKFVKKMKTSSFAGSSFVLLFKFNLEMRNVIHVSLCFSSGKGVSHIPTNSKVLDRIPVILHSILFYRLKVVDYRGLLLIFFMVSHRFHSTSISRASANRAPASIPPAAPVIAVIIVTGLI